MRILAVTPYYEPEGGGLERYAHEILKRLAARGHDVRCVANTKDHLASERLDGVAVVRRQARLRLGNTPIDPGLRSHLLQVVDDFRPNVVVAHTPVPFPAEMAYFAAQRRQTPFVVTYHAGRLRGSSLGLEAMASLDRVTVERRMLSQADALIAVGPYVRDHALRRHRDRVHIIPPGVDPTRYAPGGRPEDRSILFVGPVSSSYRWKGLDVLWNAFHMVRARFPDARLTIVGDGDRFHEFTQRAYESGRGIRLTGRLSEERLIDEYRRAAVVVLPSTSEAESFGMVLAEANACGRPVVASRIGGIPDFVHHEDNGLLAAPADPVDLAQKIMALLRDPAWGDEMGRRGRARVERDHPWDALAARTEEVLREAAKRRVANESADASLERGLAKPVQQT